jgi:hypothetical protein
MNDDHGDQFPGALPPSTPSRRAGAADRLVRMHPAYGPKVDPAVQADRARGFAEKTLIEQSPARPVDGASLDFRQRRTTGRRSPTRTPDGRRPAAGSALGRMGRLTRRSLDRFDRYTLDVFTPGHPDRPQADR